MSRKPSIKPKIMVAAPEQNNDEEVVITIPSMSEKVPKKIGEPVVPVKVLIPEQNKANVKVKDEITHNEELEEEPEEEEELEEPEEPEDVEEPEEKPAAKRRQRTKKVYPPSEDMFDELIKSMCELREVTRKIITLARETQKSTKKELKELNVRIKKEKNEKPARKPRGFALPSPISDEMMNYLVNEAKITSINRKINDQTTCPIKIEHGRSLARNELTSALCNHFRNSAMRKNELDKRDIHLDEKTTKLFGIDPKKFAEGGGRLSAKGEPIITYFDLQKYLPRHCGKMAVGH